MITRADSIGVSDLHHVDSLILCAVNISYSARWDADPEFVSSFYCYPSLCADQKVDRYGVAGPLILDYRIASGNCDRQYCNDHCETEQIFHDLFSVILAGASAKPSRYNPQGLYSGSIRRCATIIV